MNSLWKSISGLLSRTTLSQTNNITSCLTNNAVSPLLNNNLPSLISAFSPKRFKVTLQSLRRKSLNPTPPKKAKNPLGDNVPFAKGIILKTLIKKPKKPNSANRKCVHVKFSNGRQVIAYVPGIGHNLQEHQYVLIKVSNLKDVPGVKCKCVRGAYDLPQVAKQTK